MARLENKTALVTGAGSGIGEGIAKLMAAQGATIIATDRQTETAAACADAINRHGGKAYSLALDVAFEEDWQIALDFIEVKTNGLDILVNNADVEVVKPMTDISLSEWRSLMTVNVDGVFLGCQSLLPSLKKTAKANPAGASIINISSIAGMVAFPYQAGYNTSKGAVRHLTKSLAIEFADQAFNIRVNSIHPGCIRTPMLDSALDSWTKEGRFGTHDRSQVEAEMAAWHPLNRVGSVDDIANGAIYLASDEASFITGIELVIDGGYIAR